MNSEGSTPNVQMCRMCKIEFVDDLWGADAISVPWAGIIYVDKQHKDTPYMSKLLDHELGHMKYYEKYLNAKGYWRKFLRILQNNIWDFFSCWKLEWYMDKLHFLIVTGALTFAFFVLLMNVIGAFKL